MREALAGYGAMLQLDPEAMLATATERTGLDDWGDPGFRERLDVLCTALRDEAGLSDTGTAVVFEQLVGNLVNRLRLQALTTAHPEIDDVPIERPIIICGLPRTGTTHLHNLLAADPSLRYLPYWESLEPFPSPDEPDEQPRRDRCATGLDLVNTSMPEFKRMHDMTVDHAHEEIQLLANDISGMLFETTYQIPSFAAHYKSHDQAPSYAYLKRSLQAMQWLRGRNALGAEVAAAPGAVPHPARHLPGRHLRCDTPGSGGGDAVDGDDDQLRVPDGSGRARSRRDLALLAGPGRGPARRLRA